MRITCEQFIAQMRVSLKAFEDFSEKARDDNPEDYPEPQYFRDWWGDLQTFMEPRSSIVHFGVLEEWATVLLKVVSEAFGQVFQTQPTVALIGGRVVIDAALVIAPWIIERPPSEPSASKLVSYGYILSVVAGDEPRDLCTSMFPEAITREAIGTYAKALVRGAYVEQDYEQRTES